MARIPKFLLVMLVAAPGLAAQSDSDAMGKAMAQGDLVRIKTQIRFGTGCIPQSGQVGASRECKLLFEARVGGAGDGN